MELGFPGFFIVQTSRVFGLCDEPGHMAIKGIKKFLVPNHVKTSAL